MYHGLTPNAILGRNALSHQLTLASLLISHWKYTSVNYNPIWKCSHSKIRYQHHCIDVNVRCGWTSKSDVYLFISKVNPGYSRLMISPLILLLSDQFPGASVAQTSRHWRPTTCSTTCCIPASVAAWPVRLWELGPIDFPGHVITDHRPLTGACCNKAFTLGATESCLNAEVFLYLGGDFRQKEM